MSGRRNTSEKTSIDSIQNQPPQLTLKWSLVGLFSIHILSTSDLFSVKREESRIYCVPSAFPRMLSDLVFHWELDGDVFNTGRSLHVHKNNSFQ